MSPIFPVALLRAPTGDGLSGRQRRKVAPISTIGGLNTGLDKPRGIAVDPGGNIYVANGASAKVTAYPVGSNGNVAPSSTIAITAPSGSLLGLFEPYGIALDASGNIYVANTEALENDRDDVTVYPSRSNGKVTPSATIAGPSTELVAPAGIAILPGSVPSQAATPTATLTITPTQTAKNSHCHCDGYTYGHGDGRLKRDAQRRAR